MNNPPNKKVISIVIPAYNEEERLPHTLISIAEYFKNEHNNFSLEEVIVVDDGSKDGTASVARSFSKILPIKVIVISPNKGKGNAVRIGSLSSKGDCVFMYDADGATPIEELERFIEYGNNADMVIGSRIAGQESKVVMAPFRRFMGWCFHIVCSGLLPGIEDASCGAKLFSKKVAQEVFSKQRLNRFAFDIEILWLAHNLGFTIKEIPVNWFAVPGSKVNVYRDGIEMFWSVVGLYRRQMFDGRIFWKKINKKNYIAFVFAVFIGVVYVFPHIYFVQKLSGEYKGIYISRSYDEDTYYSAVRQVYDGKSPTENPYIVEYKDKTIVSMYKFLEYGVGFVGNSLGLQISNLAIASKFVFPPLIFLAIYFFILILTGSVSAGVLSGFFVLLGHEFAPLNISSAIQTFLFQSPFHSFLFFNRPINPQISAILFFMTLYFLVRLWNNPNSKKFSIISGILIGFLSYIYFYFWSFSMILVGVLFCYAILFKNKDLLKSITLAITVSLVTALPFIINMFNILNSGSASITKNYVITHDFIIEKVILLPLFLMAFVYIWNYIVVLKLKKYNYALFTFLNDKKYYFLFLLLIAGFIASNQQVIHGYEVQQHHYHFMTNIPIFIISVSMLFVGFLGQYAKSFKTLIVACFMVVIAIHGISVQASSYRFWEPIFRHYQEYSTAFDWLNRNTSTDQVIYSNITISELIPIYTHNAVYGSLHASVYPVPVERLAHNYFTMIYLRGVTASEAKDYFYNTENRNEFGQLVFEGQYWRRVCGSFGCFPDETLDKFIDDYKVFLKSPFEVNLKKYKVDYILWDKKENPQWNLERFDFLKEVLKSGEVSLLRVL